MGRTIAIGDIHGCLSALDTLLETIAPTQGDTIITLGDYVDRGPDSCGVIQRLLDLGDHVSTVHLLGNHETMLLEALESKEHMDWWLTCGGAETVASYGGVEKIPVEHLQFIQNCQYFHETEENIFIHANYLSDVDLTEQPEDILLWEHLTTTPPPPHCSGKTVIVGHTPQAACKIYDAGHLVCIDTCCFGGGCLSAYEPATGSLWQADIDGKLLRAPDAA